MLCTTAKEKQRLLVLELEAQVLDVLVLLENLLELLRDLAKALHDGLSSGLLGRTVLAERQSEHDHADELGGVGLGGGNTDFGTSVDVDTTVGHHGDGGTDNVDDTNSQGTALETVAESQERVSGLTGLGDKDAGVVTEDRSLSVEEVGSQLDGDGDLGQLLEDTTDSHARVVRGTASNEDDSAATTDGGDVLLETTQSDSLVLNVETTTHSVDDGLGLLENLLLHEVVVTALHDLLELDLDGLNGTDVGSARVLGQTVDVQLTIVDVSNIVVLEVENLLGVLDNGRRVRGQEELDGLRSAVLREESARLRAVEQTLVGRSQEVVGLLEGNVLGSSFGGKRASIAKLDIDEVNLHLSLCADTNDQGRTLAGSDNLRGEVDRLEQQTEGALKLLDDGLDEGGEVDVRVLIEDVLGQLGDGLCVGLGFEYKALGLEQSFQLLVIGDDTIVNDGELPLGVGSEQVLR